MSIKLWTDGGQARAGWDKGYYMALNQDAVSGPSVRCCPLLVERLHLSKLSFKMHAGVHVCYSLYSGLFKPISRMSVGNLLLLNNLGDGSRSNLKKIQNLASDTAYKNKNKTMLLYY